MNRTKTLLMTLMAAVVLGLGATAQAQESPPPAPPPSTTSSSSSVSLGGGAGIGVGASLSLSEVPTAAFVYDAAVFHIEGLLGFASTSNPGGASHTTSVGFGAGGWYHLHRGASSDFSLGAAIIVATTSPPVGNSTTVTAVEPGAQIRVFVTPNVSLNARVGLAFLFGDTGGGGTDIFFNGQGTGGGIGPTGAFGITYFFR